jgi:hypothetical protein
VNDRQRIRLAAVAAERLASVAAVLDGVAGDGSTVFGRLRDAQGPLRGRSYEATPRRGASTELAPLIADRALRDEDDLDRALETAAKAINRITGIVAAYPPPHPATAEERRTLGLGDGPWCTSCARVPGADGQSRREPVHVGVAGEVVMSLDGQLIEAPALCRWCYGCWRDWARIPTVAEVERHAHGLRVNWPADVPRPKESA